MSGPTKCREKDNSDLLWNVIKYRGLVADNQKTNLIGDSSTIFTGWIKLVSSNACGG